MQGQTIGNEAFARLVQRMQVNITKKETLTVLIGAGCSLTSSSDDITTVGIITKLVRRYCPQDEIPQSWFELYKKFVNVVWQGQGELERIHMLESFFEHMVPSVGYQTLRWLVEQRYITNIITTNFDDMIDKALEGLSYHLIVGTHEEDIGANPSFTLIKAHGDLKFGQLRFAPDELTQLPEALMARIRELTHTTVFVIGYRGQDIGILNALDQRKDYSAYWAAPQKPEQLDSYDNKRIYDWMAQRSSSSNFLYGDTYGKFDTLLQQLKAALVQEQEKENQAQIDYFETIWKTSSFFPLFHFNQRFLELFRCLHRLLAKVVQEDAWRITGPYYTSDFQSLLEAAVGLLKEHIIPKCYLSCIANEVDALLFSLSCSIRLLCQGYARTPNELLDTLHQQYRANLNIENAMIEESFWDTVLALSSFDFHAVWTAAADETVSGQRQTSLRFEFGKDGNLQTVLKSVDILGLQKLLALVQTLTMFQKTSVQNSIELVARGQKQTLEKHLHNMSCDPNSLVRVELSKVRRTDYENALLPLLSPIFQETRIDQDRILSYGPIRVMLVVEEGRDIHAGNIWEALSEEASEKRSVFLSGFCAEQYVPRPSAQFFYDFLNAQSTGLFVLGQSGCGKTAALQSWISQLDETRYLVYPVLGSRVHAEIGGRLVLERCLQGERALCYTEAMLAQRNQALILVLDAINEIGEPFSVIITYYQKLLQLCDDLAKQRFFHIKVVITCRREFYLQMKKSAGREPSSSSFYTCVSSADSQPVFYLPLLTDREAEQFAAKYLVEKRYVSRLKQEFGDLIYLPINLQIICSAIHAPVTSDPVGGTYGIYDVWFERLLEAAQKDSFGAEVLWAVMYKAIEFRFFSKESRTLRTGDLSVQLSAQYPNVLPAFQWLVQHNVFICQIRDPNLVLFSHDRLVEFFLRRYIQTAGIPLPSLRQALTSESLTDPIVRQSVQDTIFTLFSGDKLEYINQIVSILRGDDDWLSSILIDALLRIAAEKPDTMTCILQETSQYILKRQFWALIRSILLKINQMLDDMTCVGTEAVSAVCQAINGPAEQELFDLQLLGWYMKAKQMYQFPDEKNTKTFEEALAICQDAEKLISELTPTDLADQLLTLKALLLQNLGNLNPAISIMERCYHRQMENAMYDEACRSALRLGAMYREMTRFEDAIDLYNGFSDKPVSNRQSHFRLLMNTGIIYKNMIQNAMFCGEINSEANLANYIQARENYKKTLEYAQNTDDVKLLLEIYAEFVELGCIAYYMDQGTIREAEYWVEQIDAILPRYQVPRMKILRELMWARVFILKCELENAYRCLKSGFEIGCRFSLPFYSTDCCNLITGMMCDAIHDAAFATDQNLLDAIRYGSYAISYYQQLGTESHRYLRDSIEKQNRLLAEWRIRHGSEPELL